MAVRIFDNETWIKIGSPALGSRMFYFDKTTKEKVWGFIAKVYYNHKRGVKIKIKPYK